MKYILGSHSKVQTEFLYLETGAVPLAEVIKTRRMIYLQNILKRPKEEVIRKVYEAQKLSPVMGDWTELVTKDFYDVGIILNEKEIIGKSKSEHKSLVKDNIKQHVFDKLKKLQLGHSKISHIKYKTFETQKYLTNHKLNNHEVSLLFSLRSRTAREFKANFPYNIEQLCPFGCEELDTQEHCLLCEKAYPNSLRNPDIVYDDIFSDDSAKQLAAVKLIATLLERREDTSSLNTGPSCCPEGDSNSSHACTV